MNKKVFVIGLDGATWDVIDPLIAKDELPTLNTLIQNGTRGNLKSVLISASPSAWTTFATGCSPDHHGIFDFTYRKEGTYDSIPYSSRNRKRETLWELLSREGKKVCVLNIPGTYPVDKVNGYMISGFPTPEEREDFTYPKSLLQELRTEFGQDFRVQPRIPIQEDKQFLEEMYLVTDYVFKATTYLMDHKPWDFFTTVFMATDSIQHAFWRSMDSDHPMHNPKVPPEFKHAIFEVYKDMDKKIEQLHKRIDTDTALMIVSDHGFGPLHYGVSINNWLLSEGYLALKKKLSTRARYWLFRRGVNYDNLIRVVRVMKLTKRATNAAYAEKSFTMDLVNKFFITNKDIDWGRTRAYCMGSGGELFINLKGREPQGFVEPNGEYDRLVDEIVNKLHTLKDPSNERIIFNIIQKKKEAYSSSTIDDALADIIFIDEGMKYAIVRFFVFGSRNLISKHPVWTGIHKPQGIFLVCGDNQIRKSTNIDGANLCDIAPTVLHLMGFPIPQNIDGKVLREIFEKNSEEYERQTMYQSRSQMTEIERVNERIKELKRIGKI